MSEPASPAPVKDQHDVLMLRLTRGALDRLIGGVSEVEVSLRAQIVEDFSKRHFDTIVKNGAMKKVLEEARKGVMLEVADLIGSLTYKSGHLTSTIKEPVRKMIEEEAEVQVKVRVNNAVTVAIDKYTETRTDVLRRYEAKMTNEINSRIDDVINRIEKGLDARMDEAFEKRVQAEVSRRLAIAAAS